MSDSDTDSEASVEPPSKIINGSHIAAQIRLEIAHAVKELAAESAPFGEPVVPGLAVILGAWHSATRLRDPHTSTHTHKRARTHQPAGLSCVSACAVGDRADSATYVRMKKKACAQVGILDLSPPPLPSTATQAEVLEAVAALNLDPRVHGILVQLPLPQHIDEQVVYSVAYL